MRILFLSQVLPYPLDAGPKMRSYYVIRHLAQKHEVTLLTFIRESDNASDIDHMAGICHAVHTVPIKRSRAQDLRFSLQSVLTAQPFLILRDHSPAIMDTLQQVVTSTAFDVIHADQLWMAQYVLAAKKFSPQSKLILDQHNAVYLIPQRLAGDEVQPLKRRFLAGESKRLAAYEQDICGRFDQVVWVSSEDRQAVTALSPSKVTPNRFTSVIPICANLSSDDLRPLNPNRFRITFMGGLH